MYAFPRIGRRVGTERLVVIGTLAFALRALLASLIVDPVALVLVAPLEGIGFAFVFVGGVTVLGARAPAGLQGTAQGMFAAASGLATIIGSVLGGAIAGALGIPGLFLLCAAGSLVGTVIVAFALLRPPDAGATPDRGLSARHASAARCACLYSAAAHGTRVTSRSHETVTRIERRARSRIAPRGLQRRQSPGRSVAAARRVHRRRRLQSPAQRPRRQCRAARSRCRRRRPSPEPSSPSIAFRAVHRVRRTEISTATAPSVSTVASSSMTGSRRRELASRARSPTPVERDVVVLPRRTTSPARDPHAEPMQPRQLRNRSRRPSARASR